MNKSSVDQFKESLPFLHRAELRLICQRYTLSTSGTKPELLQRIVHFVETGREYEAKKVAAVSQAKRGAVPSLHPRSLILQGVYKNDLKTRLFFKKLIGEHFHFTAFGIDWVKSRWQEGKPPTYQEFAHMWEEEFKKRQQKKADPKNEWAYICFMQRFLKMNPQASRQELLKNWHEERGRHKNFVAVFLTSHACRKV